METGAQEIAIVIGTTELVAVICSVIGSVLLGAITGVITIWRVASGINTRIEAVKAKVEKDDRVFTIMLNNLVRQQDEIQLDQREIRSDMKDLLKSNNVSSSFNREEEKERIGLPHTAPEEVKELLESSNAA